MRRFITGLSAIVAGTTLGSCSIKQPPCPAEGQTFRVLPLTTTLAKWDHANAAFDGDRVVVSFAQGALGEEGASSVWAQPVSCEGEVGEPVMVSRSLGTGAQPAEAVDSTNTTWFIWGASSSASTGTTDPTDGGVPDAGNADAGYIDVFADAGYVDVFADAGTATDDAGVLTPVASPVHGSALEHRLEEPSLLDLAVPITRDDKSFENVTEVHQAISGSRETLAIAGGRAIKSNECLIPFVQRFSSFLNSPDDVANLEPYDSLGCLAGPTAIAGSASDGFHIAWLQRPTGAASTDPKALLYASWSKKQNTLTSATTVAVDNLSAPSASQGSEKENAPHYLAYAFLGDGATAPFIKVFDMSRGAGSELRLDLALTDTLVGRPFIAGAENGGAVAWTVNTSDGKKMFVQRFNYAGGAFGAVTPVVELSSLASTKVGTIESLTHLIGNSYFVTWTQTRSVTERNLLQGGFVTF